MTALTWGRWRLNERNVSLEYWDDERGNIYYIDFETCRTSAGILDWVFQVHKKTFIDDRDRADLIHALDDILDPQANYCSWGESKSADPVALVRSCRGSLAWKERLGRLLKDLTIPHPDETTR